jgi:8-oxo-dGTP diphosphatase
LFGGHLQVFLRQVEKLHVWELPGSQHNPDQSLEQTAAACLEDYTSLQASYLDQLYTYGAPGRAPEHVLSVVYIALTPADAIRKRDAQSPAVWFPVEQLPQTAMDHGIIIQYALRRLRYKLEYSAAGFELLPETFTLSEIQNAYEMILGEKLDKRNFRRRILKAGIIEPTAEQRTGEGRPARLYHYRADAVAEVKARRLFP